MKNFFTKALTKTVTKTLTTVATIAAICFASTTIVRAAGAPNLMSDTSQENSLPLQPSQNQEPANQQPSPQQPQAPIQQSTPVSQPLTSQSYSQSFSQNYNIPSTYNSSSSCGVQVTAKTNNGVNNTVEWGIGFTINLNNPCVAQVPTKQETLSCHQQRLRGMEMLLNYHNQNQDPKHPKQMLPVAELNGYLNTICIIS